MPFGLGFFATAGVSAAGGSYELIASEILTSSQSSVTFSNLGDYASTYQHLQIRITGRSTRAETDSVFRLRFNGDTGTNYGAHFLQGTGSSVTSGDLNSQNTGIYSPYVMTGATATTSAFGAGVIDILDPYEAKNKTTRMLAGQMHSGYTRIALHSGLWRSTASVTSIELIDIFGSWASGSRLSLYGIKGA